jgi:hypothetical protein
MKELYSTGPSTTWFAPTNIPNNGYAKQLQFDVIGERIPIEYVWKASQWLMISSFHAKRLIGLCAHLINSSSSENIKQLIISNPLFSLFRDTRASDEMFFPTCLSMLGFFPPASTDSATIIQRHVTYSDWSAKGRNPKTFTPYQHHDILPALQQQSCFFRKIQFLTLNASFILQNSLNTEQARQERMQLLEAWWKSVYQQSHQEEVVEDGSIRKEHGTLSECVLFIDDYFAEIASQQSVVVVNEKLSKDANTSINARNDKRNDDRLRSDQNSAKNTEYHQRQDKRSRSRSRDRDDQYRNDRSYKNHNNNQTNRFHR